MSEVFIGLDGGGSNLRAVATDAQLNLLAEVQNSGVSANPSVVGLPETAAQISAILEQVLRAIDRPSSAVRAVGLGIAGMADPRYHADLRSMVGAVLPDAQAVISSDFEIALIGATGERRGILLLAGTGSVGFGVNAAGEQALVGGWGYQLGDEGGGSWIGREALRLIVAATDQGIPCPPLGLTIMKQLGIEQPRDLVSWLYGRSATPPVREIAALAQTVLAAAAAHDSDALTIVEAAADALFRIARLVQQRLNVGPDFKRNQLAFAGGLLQQSNPLSQRVCSRLGLPTLPIPRYPPVIGAAILAIEEEKANSRE
ncbi:MAG: hypothetical protein KF726_18655 [Anaerolineae bacterium]|nr:hypothetical protein [Anaerolineae bacterium]